MPALTVENQSLLRRAHAPALGDVARPVVGVTTAPRGFEGEGFPVRRAFAGVDLAALDPFVHMDQMGEVEYAPGEPKGTPWHPHRGFETVTYMIDGVMDHQDSQGGGGTITNGDTQWMTAGSGMLHIETPPEWLVASGGLFHGIQLWVNLPRAQKWARPRYQDLRSSSLGVLTSADAGALVRVIAGDVRVDGPDGGPRGVVTGPGSTYSPMTMVHASLAAGARLDLPWQVDYNALVYVLSGSATVGVEQRPLQAGRLAVLGAGDFVPVGAAARQDSRTPVVDLLVLGGLPIREPVAWGGPFVMNTKAEVLQAFEDFQRGAMGQVPAVHGLTNEILQG